MDDTFLYFFDAIRNINFLGDTRRDVLLLISVDSVPRRRASGEALAGAGIEAPTRLA